MRNNIGKQQKEAGMVKVKLSETTKAAILNWVKQDDLKTGNHHVATNLDDYFEVEEEFVDVLIERGIMVRE